MRAPPDEFRRRVHVRLPFADRYLAGGKRAEEASQEIRRAFGRPILRVLIPAAPRSETAATDETAAIAGTSGQAPEGPAPTGPGSLGPVRGDEGEVPPQAQP